MATYADVKACAIDVVDDFTEMDLAANYAPAGKANFSAKTKMTSLTINETTLAGMTIRFNKAMGKLCGDSWNKVGSFDMVKLTTVGQCIQLACAKSGTNLPVGEPK